MEAGENTGQYDWCPTHGSLECDQDERGERKDTVKAGGGDGQSTDLLCVLCQKKK